LDTKVLDLATLAHSSLIEAIRIFVKHVILIPFCIWALFPCLDPVVRLFLLYRTLACGAVPSWTMRAWDLVFSFPSWLWNPPPWQPSSDRIFCNIARHIHIHSLDRRGRSLGGTTCEEQAGDL